MELTFDPKTFPNRMIFIDTNLQPKVEKMNCLGCNRMVEKLGKAEQLCSACYEQWRRQFRERWVKGYLEVWRETRPPVSL